MVAWAMVIVVSPRRAGQPIICSSETNSSSRDRPRMTSGITIGARIEPAKDHTPAKAPEPGERHARKGAKRYGNG